MKIELENVLPREIEKRSFELITEELWGENLSGRTRTDHQTLHSHQCRF